MLLVFARHKDRPGIMGRIGTIIGDAGININQVQVSQSTQHSSQAMMVLCLGQPLPTESYQQIQAMPDIRKALIVKLA